MSQTPQKILVAPAWPYANGPRHIGHVAGFGVPSDVFARYQRMSGNRVLMVSGTDEHGTPIQVPADREGVAPASSPTATTLVIAKDLRDLGMSYDLFTRTTTENHYAVAQEIFLGLLRTATSSRDELGAITPSTGRTLPDRYVEGTCPICGYDERARRPVRQLRQPARPDRPDRTRARNINGETPEFRETEHFFLDLPAFAELLATGCGSRTHWRPNVQNSRSTCSTT